MKKENNKGVTLFKKEDPSRFPEKKILTKPEMKTAKIKNTLLGRVKAPPQNYFSNQCLFELKRKPTQ